MQKRIFKNMAILACSILVAILLLTGVACYQFFYVTRENEVQSEASYIAAALDDLQEPEYVSYLEDVGHMSGMRITLIDTDGDVVYDNESDSETMENHRERPEVKEAYEHGYSSDTRLSATLDVQTFYYAIRLSDGKVVRVSCETRSIFIMLLQAIPAVCIVLGLMLAIALSKARSMTAAIVEPINNIDLQNPDTDFVYEELNPLLMRIKDYNAEVCKNEQMRKEFSANVSHELKTPLTSISGYAELLKNGLVKPEDILDFADKIYIESGRMIELVDDIIKLSRLDEKRVAIEKENINLLELAKPLEESLLAMSRKYKVLFSVEGEAVSVQAVPVMMEEVMYNLATNAIKYNHPGGYATLRIGYQEGRPMIQMADNGIGIRSEHQKRIFERFYRVDKSRSKQTGGTGLGLAIVKHVAEYHSGTISVESHEGKGTVITVLL